jgi:hypothetical protein
MAKVSEVFIMQNLSDEDLCKKVKSSYGTYMYYECAERGYDAVAARAAHEEYLVYAKEANSRGIEINWE